jgi:hypothetical protein
LFRGDDEWPLGQYDTDKFAIGIIELYERLFEKLKNKQIALLEIGVWHGGSLQYFSNFFRNGMIVGIDLQQPSLRLPDNVEFRSIDQNDSDALRQLAEEKGPFDIVIDDGSHRRRETSNCFDVLWRYVKEEGAYIIEDWAVGYRSDEVFKGMVELVTGIILKKEGLGIRAIDLEVNESHSVLILRKQIGRVEE